MPQGAGDGDGRGAAGALAAEVVFGVGFALAVLVLEPGVVLAVVPRLPVAAALVVGPAPAGVVLVVEVVVSQPTRATAVRRERPGRANLGISGATIDGLWLGSMLISRFGVKYFIQRSLDMTERP